MNKRGQMELSFGMIFSLFLIIIFIAFAFYAISKFLSLSDSAVIGKFKESVQNDIDKLWKGSQGVWSPKSGYTLPKGIELVCFADFSEKAKGNKKDIYVKLNQLSSGGDRNMVFYPNGAGTGLNSFTMEHIDIKKITLTDNPYCAENKKGKVMLTLNKEFGENLITITG